MDQPAILLGTALLVGLLALRVANTVVENRNIRCSLDIALDSLADEYWQAEASAIDLDAAKLALETLRVELESKNRTLAEANARLESQATTDGMTGLANHRAFQERLRDEITRARRLGNPLSVIMLDVDRFKHYNDSYGHPAGDELLQTIATLIQETVRDVALVARYGGDEFAILLPDTTEEDALSAAERIRRTIADQAFPERHVTVSLGVSALSIAGCDPKDLIGSADVALYMAKKAGRNQFMLGSGKAALDDDTAACYLERLSTQSVAAELSECESDEKEIADGGFQGLLQEDIGHVLASLMTLLEVREGTKAGHTKRVMRYALRLCRELSARGMELDPGEIRNLVRGALLHDIGKLGVPESILLKRTPLDQYERKEIRRHPEYGAQLACFFQAFLPGLPVIRSHHERWDGNGYPDGAAGNEIPLAARIFGVVDAFDEMTTDRPYRVKMSYSDAVSEIARFSGTQFDPEIVAAFLAVDEREWRQLSRSATAERHLIVKSRPTDIRLAA